MLLNWFYQMEDHVWEFHAQHIDQRPYQSMIHCNLHTHPTNVPRTCWRSSCFLCCPPGYCGMRATNFKLPQMTMVVFSGTYPHTHHLFFLACPKETQSTPQPPWAHGPTCLLIDRPIWKDVGVQPGGPFLHLLRVRGRKSHGSGHGRHDHGRSGHARLTFHGSFPGRKKGLMGGITTHTCVCVCFYLFIYLHVCLWYT